MKTARRFRTNLGLTMVLAALVTNADAQELPPEQPPGSATQPADQSAGSDSAEATQPDFEALGDRAAERLPRMADRIFQSMGSRIVRTLTNSGLSQTDSEEIARRYASDFAGCARSAFMIEAERQSISINELLTRLLEVTYIGNVDVSDPDFDPIQNVSRVLDFHSMNANLVPCVIGAMQDAGISFESGIDALPESARIDSQ